jgi:hypothetical protein
MVYIRSFLLIYLIVVALIFGLLKNAAKAKIVPGDIFIQKAGRTIYIPLGSSLIVTALVFAIMVKYIH